jgi:D-amino-acid oxidase
VIVLGAGVSGSTCALALREAGFDVEVVARELSPHTTSDVAAAFWYPYKAEPRARVVGWAKASWHRFAALAADSTAGVTMRRAIELWRSEGVRPWWTEAVPFARPAAADELPAGYAAGWCFDAPVIDMRRYMPWLRARLERSGVRVVVGEVASLHDVLAAHDVVVDCTGLGARALCSDRELFPIRGQIVRVADPGVETVTLDEDDPGGIAYVVPRGDDCVLGGTAEIGREDLAIDEAQSEAIVGRCARLDPRLGTAQRRGTAVGLRPGRSQVRLEAERPQPGKLVVHDYGHGGAGVTLSWGCAVEVVDIVREASQ